MTTEVERETRSCHVCGAPYCPVKPWQKACSSKCNSIAGNTRRRAVPSVKRCRTCCLDLPVEKYAPAHRSCLDCEAIRDAGRKRCNRCKEIKDRSDFYNRTARADGLDSTCKSCRSRQFKERNATPEAKRKARDYKYRLKYGIGVEEVEAMLGSQDGRCAICRGCLESKIFHVDHDHQTGAVRALLCVNCNSLLGHSAERIDVLLAAIAYLERHSNAQIVGP